MGLELERGYKLGSQLRIRIGFGLRLAARVRQNGRGRV